MSLRLAPNWQRGFLVLAWVVAWGFLLGATCPAPNHTSSIGVHGKPTTSLAAMDVIRDAGFKWIRVQVLWNLVEPQDNTWDFVETDARLTAAATRGFSTLVYFHGVPTWAGGGANNNQAPNNADYFKDFVRHVIDHQVPTLGNLRVGEVAAAFELWNEPNENRFWSSSSSAWKTKILVPGIAAIQEAKAAAGYSPAFIVAPATVKSNGDSTIGPYVSGHMADIDIVSIHAYGQENDQINSMKSANTWCEGNLDCLEFWVTEAGYCHGGCSLGNNVASPGASLLHNQQACDSLGILWCSRDFIFNLHDVDGNGDSGLVNVDQNGQVLVRNRLCRLEEDYGAPLAEVDPCPCSVGKPGCANVP